MYWNTSAHHAMRGLVTSIQYLQLLLHVAAASMCNVCTYQNCSSSTLATYMHAALEFCFTMLLHPAKKLLGVTLWVNEPDASRTAAPSFENCALWKL